MPDLKLVQPSIEDKAKEVFKSPLGREVLAYIVFIMCNYGSTLDPENREAIGKYNLAVDLLDMVELVIPKLVMQNVLPPKREPVRATNALYIKSKFLSRALLRLGLARW